ncbi:MAG: proton-conducting transporter membrane subunit [Planctomycetaceae bacterium]
MNDSVTIAAALVPLATLFAGLAVLLIRGSDARHARIRSTIGVAGAGVAFLAAAYLFYRFQQSDAPAAYSWQLRAWLDVSGGESIDGGFGLRINPLSTLVIVAMCFAVLIARANSFFGGEEDVVADSASLLVLAATSLMLCSSHIVQFLLFWQLSATVGFVATAVRGADPISGGAARKGFLLGRVGDMSLILGLLLLSRQILQNDLTAGLSWLEVLSNSATIATESESDQMMLVAAAIFLLGGVATRSGQIPFLGWVDDVASTSTPMNLLMQTSLLMPAGIALIIFCSPVIGLSQPLQHATLTIGGFTVFFASLSAACSSGAQRVLGYATCSILGWVLLGIGIGTATGTVAAIRLIILQIVASAAACCVLEYRKTTAETGDGSSTGVAPVMNSRTSSLARERRWTFLVVAAILVSGIWGQGAILAALWDSAAAPTSTSGQQSQSPGSGISILLLVLGTLGTLFLSTSLFREFFTAALDKSESPPRRTEGGFWLGVAMVLTAIALLLLERSALSVERIAATVAPAPLTAVEFDWSGLGIGILPALIGIVVAWMRLQSAAESPKSFGWFVRLSRSRYYFDDFFFLAIELPIRAMGQLSRFFDWFLIDGILVQIPSRIPAHVAKLARPLQNSAAQIAALTIVLATAVLLAVIVWLRG